MSETKRNVPKLRFPGFEGEWEQRKLGELYERVNERNDGSLGRDKWISVAKMYFQDPEKVQSNNLDTRTYVMQRGDIAFEGHPNSEFKFGRFVLNDIGTGIISELFPIYRPIVEYDLNFWKYAIQLERIMAPIFAKSITSSGNSSNKLDQNHFLKQTITTPTVDEQKAIGSFFENISNLIVLYQRKLENLKLKKKALLQKLFPKNGEQFPELRFPGFTDAWEQRKFADVFDTLQNNTLSRSELDFEVGRVKNVHYGDVLIKYGDFIDVAIDKLPYIKDEKIVKRFTGSLLQDGDIIIADTAEDSTVGKCSEIIGTSGIKVLSGLHTIPCRPKEKYAPKYMGYYINSNAYHQQLIPLMQGIKVTSISRGAIKDTNVFFPKSYDEQAKIGESLSNIDNLITLHQRKLEHLQLQKKALLQQMFV